MSSEEESTKDFNCPCCNGEIDALHYAFVIQVTHDPKLLEAWMAGNYTFEMWKGEQGYE